MSTDTASSCPVDHKSREAFLKTTQQQPTLQSRPEPPISPPSLTTPLPASCDSRSMSTSPRPTPNTPHNLSTVREVSSIPRAPPTPPTATTTTTSTPNAQTHDPHTSPSGNWIYPSEAMFFSAMKRKRHSAEARDMAAVIPIHNAVNERTWTLIKEWEAPYCAPPPSWYASSKNSTPIFSPAPVPPRPGVCGGPKLVSFSGDSTRLTPRARWNALLGYSRPFDRHDWVVDRCGKKVEYVIDFYAGKPARKGAEELGRGDAPSFYLDVRPKLNSFEGWKMRASRFIGWAKAP